MPKPTKRRARTWVRVGWCPRDGNGHIHVEHATDCRDLIEADIPALNQSGFAPYSIVPLYVRRVLPRTGRKK